jgi:hypothetical protein
MNRSLRRIRVMALIWMPTEFFVALDEAKRGAVVSLRIMGGVAAILSALILLEVFRSYREGGDDGEAGPDSG